jgi:hypothetical protein
MIVVGIVLTGYYANQQALYVAINVINENQRKLKLITI